MPEIAIKMTANDASFKRSIAETALNVKNWGREAMAVYAQTRTPVEAFAISVERLNKLFKSGIIDAETYNRRIAQLQKTPAAGGFGGLDVKNQLQQLGGALGGGLGSAAVAAILNPWTAGIAGVVAFGAAVRSSAMAMDDASDAADRLGIGLHTFLQLETAAKTLGLGASELSSNFLKMEKNIAEAALEGGKMDRVLQGLGLDSQDLLNKNPAGAFKDIAVAVLQIENRMERARVEAEIFGKSGAKLEGVLRAAADGLDRMVTASAEAAHNLAKLGDFLEKKGLTPGALWQNFLGSIVGDADALISLLSGKENLAIQFSMSNLVKPITEKHSNITDQLEAQAAKMYDEMAEEEDRLLGKYESRLKSMERSGEFGKMMSVELREQLKLHDEILARKKDQAELEKITIDAYKFMGQMNREMLSGSKDTAREGRLRRFAEAGIDPVILEALGLDVARLDAMDEVGKFKPSLARSASYGSQAAYNLIAGREEGAKADKQLMVEQRMEQHLARIETILRDAKPRVAPVP